MKTGKALSTREIVDRLLANARGLNRSRDYIQALEDVIHYDEQHARNRPRGPEEP